MKDKTKDKIAICLMFVGYVCIASAIALFLYNIWDEDRAEKKSAAIITMMDAYMDKANGADDKPDDNDVPIYVRYPDMEMPTVTIDDVKYIGRIDIPELELSLPVTEEFDKSNIKNSPCCYTGSVYQDNIIIAAYNYDCHFGRLKQLEAKSPIYFTDMDGNCFSYEMAETEKLTRDELNNIEAGDWAMTLVAYAPGGFSSITVRLERVD
jgi:sortase A